MSFKFFPKNRDYDRYIRYSLLEIYYTKKLNSPEGYRELSLADQGTRSNKAYDNKNWLPEREPENSVVVRGYNQETGS